MATAKTAGFRWLPSYYEALRGLPDGDRLKLYDAVLDFGFGNDVEELPPTLQGFFRLIVPTLEKSVKFEEKQKLNGAKGGRPAKPKANPPETQAKPRNNQNDFGENLALGVAFAVDNALDVADGKPPRAARFTPPSIEEVRAYCAERRNSVDPQRFVDFYASKGWKVGNSAMKDWRAAVRTWEAREDHGTEKQTAAPPTRRMSKSEEYAAMGRNQSRTAAEMNKLLADLDKI